jgi:hypothetical protein
MPTKQYRKVLRPFEVSGTLLKVGDAVEVSGWKHTDKLITMRYLSPTLLKGVEPTEEKSTPKAPAKKKAVAKEDSEA